MTLEQSRDYIVHNITTLLHPEQYKRFIAIISGLYEYDFVNQFLILCDRYFSTEVHSEFIWRSLGCTVINGERPITLIIPKYKTVYTLAESGEPLKEGELPISEIGMAVRLGMVTKKIEVCGYTSGEVYDVSQVVIVDTDKYSLGKTGLSNKSAVEIVTRINQNFELELNIADGYESSYSSVTGGISIGENSSTEEIISACIDGIVHSKIAESEDEGLLGLYDTINSGVKAAVMLVTHEDSEIDVKYITKLSSEETLSASTLLSIFEAISSISREVISCIYSDGSKELGVDREMWVLSKLNTIDTLIDMVSASEVYRKHFRGIGGK